MTALVVVGSILAGLTVWFGCGMIAVKRNLPRFWERSRKDWYGTSVTRSSVHNKIVLCTLGGPVSFVVLAIAEWVRATADAGDPERAEREAEELRKYTRELERKLGM